MFNLKPILGIALMFALVMFGAAYLSAGEVQAHDKAYEQVLELNLEDGAMDSYYKLYCYQYSDHPTCGSKSRLWHRLAHPWYYSSYAGFYDHYFAP